MIRMERNVRCIAIFLPLLFLLFSCAPRVETLSVFSDSPINKTFIRCYPSIRTIYKSDRQLILSVNFNVIRQSDNHVLRWEIFDESDNSIYLKDERDFSIKPRYFYSIAIELTETLKNKLNSGTYTINVYLDGALAESAEVVYVPESIINENVSGAVVFSSNHAEALRSAVLRSNILVDTVDACIYSEVKRIIPDTVPPSVSRGIIGDSRNITIEKIREHEDELDKDIYVWSSIEIGKYIGDNNSLTVTVYDSKTGTTKEFRSNTSGLHVDVTLKDLLRKTLHETGFVDYLRSLGADRVKT